MIKILHIGALNGNLGDNIAVRNVQKSFKSKVNDIEFIMLDIKKFWSMRNDPDFIISTIKLNEPDAVLLGGGGLVEYHSYNSQKTGQKLPLNERIINECGVPVFLYGVGINTFRGNGDWPTQIKKTVKNIFSSVAECSLRNDGSIEKAHKLEIYTNNILEIPDPGLLHHPTMTFKSNFDTGVFQPAMNGNKSINKHRFLSFESEVKSLPNKYGLSVFPHTEKDFGFSGNYILKSSEFKEMAKFGNVDKTLSKYYDYDYIVAMRGHGQLVSIGMNIPGIYLSTQDKVTDFSVKNGFSDYNVDIKDLDWKDKLDQKISMLKNNPSYSKNWYEIRNSKMQEWLQQDAEFVERCLSHI